MWGLDLVFFRDVFGFSVFGVLLLGLGRGI